MKLKPNIPPIDSTSSHFVIEDKATKRKQQGYVNVSLGDTLIEQIKNTGKELGFTKTSGKVNLSLAIRHLIKLGLKSLNG